MAKKLLAETHGVRIVGYVVQVGEVRAAMNLVNGWMYTGLGPDDRKDSSKAQNLMAVGVGSMYAGRGIADVVSEVGDQRGVDPGVMFVAEIRGPIADSPLYVGGAVSAGYLLDFYVGGRVVIGVRFGPREVTP